MLDEALIGTVREGLYSPETDVYLAPIRHHSPACAWAVRQMIREIRPKQVLIEAPYDFESLIPHLLDQETMPPVAIASLLDQKAGPRLAAYYPFCGHSPEWVALHEGAAVHAKLRFIDLGSDAKIMASAVDPRGPVSLTNEQKFDSGDYVRALAARLGCRDGYELWDHLFETRLGTQDWRGFLGDVGAYCAGLRAATPEDKLTRSGDAEREAHMAACLKQAIGDGPIVVVIGGFHTAALLAPNVTAGKTKPCGKSAAQSYLIRYGYRELDALMGYGAGLPQPAYYEELWQHVLKRDGKPNWPLLSHDLVHDFAAQTRKTGHSISVPSQVELLRSAETLARLRGRPGALRHDLIDGVNSALLKGEATNEDVWTERFISYLRGHAIGEVAAGAGQPPIVADARARAKRHRFDVSDGLRRERSLDIRRKPPQLQASRFAHAMTLLGTDFATRNGGPDFLNSTQTGLLFEHWEYAWSPRVEGQLIEAAIHGDTVPSACLGKLAAARVELAEDGQAQNLSALIGLFKQGLLAGLGEKLQDFLAEIESAIRQSGGFAETALAVCDLHAIETSRGPLSLPDGLAIAPAMQAAFDRIIYLCDDLPNQREDALPPCLDALRMMSDLLRGPGSDAFDASLFDSALDRVAEADPAPEILGAVTAISVQAGRKDSSSMAKLLSGQFNGSSPDLAERLGGLRGMLWVVPALLWTAEGILETLDHFISDLEEEGFIEILPHLRLALSQLSPREADLVAELLAARLGGTAGEFSVHHHDVDEATASAGAKIDQTLRESLAKDGLLDWVVGQGEP